MGEYIVSGDSWAPLNTFTKVTPEHSRSTTPTRSNRAQVSSEAQLRDLDAVALAQQARAVAVRERLALPLGVHVRELRGAQRVRQGGRVCVGALHLVVRALELCVP